jgi:site-specific DNA-cytosine methylase
MIGAIRGRNPDNPKSRKSGLPTQQMLELNENGVSNAITTVQKDNVVVQISQYQGDKVTQWDSETHPCLSAQGGNKLRGVGIQERDYKIRRLTPRECFRLMDFPDTFTWSVSDTQAYKQAGNSIVVNVLAKIIARLKVK